MDAIAGVTLGIGSVVQVIPCKDPDMYVYSDLLYRSASKKSPVSLWDGQRYSKYALHLLIGITGYTKGGSTVWQVLSPEGQVLYADCRHVVLRPVILSFEC